jgi:hypothetical protein
MDEIIVRTNTLYKLSGAGRVRQWTGYVVKKEDGLYYSRKEFGQQGGKQVIEDSLGVPKNVGKANETSSYEQAFKEMKADEAKKRKSGYNENCIANKFFKPQKLHTYLAKDGSGKRDKFDWTNGAWLTRKYNGICYLVGPDTTDQWTRGLEFYSLPFLHLPYKLDYTLVGELYLENKASTIIAGALKGMKMDLLKKAKYVVFDCYGGDSTSFEDRREYLSTLDLPAPYELDLGVKVNTEEEALDLHKTFVAEGEEGTVIREPLGIYRPDYRSYQVQRIKDVDSDVVTITNISVDARGCAIFFVRLDKHNEVLEFDVTPTGSLEDRRVIYYNRETYIGKTVEIKYMSYGQNGIPLFANALLETIK